MLKTIGVLTGAGLLVATAALPAHAREPLPDATSDAFLREVVEAANRHRAAHHAPPLRLDGDLTRYAKSRARAISAKDRLDDVADGLRRETGQTVYRYLNTADVVAGGEKAVNSWYGEVKDYDFDRPGYSPKTGNFTQLVWKASTRVGAARVTGRGERGHETLIVLTYEKRGNVEGEYRKNVLRADGGHDPNGDHSGGRPEGRPDTRPEDTTGPATKPEQSKPEESKPGQWKPEQSKPEESKPEESKPEESKP